MTDLQMRDVSEAVLVSTTEAQEADWHRQKGMHIVHHLGRYWKETRPGFYEPSHWMARLSNQEAARPAPLCWGFRASLREDDAAAANGLTMPVHLLTNVADYDIQTLPRNHRNHLRKSHKLVKIVELTGPALLQEQGHEVLLSALKRAAYMKAPSKQDYIADIADHTTPGRRLILAGLIDTKLGGYITAHAVNGTAYIEFVHLATEALKTQIGTGLIFEFVQVCRRSGQIHEIVYGQHSREDAALCIYKEGMGFAVQHIPAKVGINPLIKQLIRWRRPNTYYRLTGHDQIKA